MNTSAYHLNLLKQSEHVSSSPIRLRVLAPLFAFFAIIGMIVWWGSLFAQMLIVKSDTSTLTAENEQNAQAEKSAQETQSRFQEMDYQLRQIKGYEASVRRIGPALTSLAVQFQTLPMGGIQFLSMEIEPLKEQDLTQKKTPKVPLRGPTNTIERQTFILTGRTRIPSLVDKEEFKKERGKSDKKEDKDLTGIFKSEELAPLSSQTKPTYKSFNEKAEQGEGSDKGKTPFTRFTATCTMPERNFAAPKEGAKK